MSHTWKQCYCAAGGSALQTAEGKRASAAPCPDWGVQGCVCTERLSCTWVGCEVHMEWLWTMDCC